MRKSFFLIVPVMIALSCGRQGNQASNYSLSGQEAAPPKLATRAAEQDASAPVQGSDIVTVDRKIIKTGDVRFETGSLEDTRKTISESLTKYKGYVSNEGENNYGDRLEVNMNVRIPAEHFDIFLEEITRGIKRFDYRNIGTQDVTEEYIDIESRLNTKKELEKRYIEILSRAKTVTEMLEIERELNTVRADIESITGRLKYLQSQVAYSTLNINFYKANVQSLGFGNKVVQGFANGWQYLLKFLIGLVNLWPFILMSVLGLWLAFRISKRQKNKSGNS
jgi:hypothetical protein